MWTNKLVRDLAVADVLECPRQEFARETVHRVEQAQGHKYFVRTSRHDHRLDGTKTVRVWH